MAGKQLIVVRFQLFLVHITAGKDISFFIAYIDGDRGVLLDDRTDEVYIGIHVRINELLRRFCPYIHVLLLFRLQFPGQIISK